MIVKIDFWLGLQVILKIDAKTTVLISHHHNK